jgi:hypothetical protein
VCLIISPSLEASLIFFTFLQVCFFSKGDEIHCHGSLSGKGGDGGKKQQPLQDQSAFKSNFNHFLAKSLLINNFSLKEVRVLCSLKLWGTFKNNVCMHEHIHTHMIYIYIYMHTPPYVYKLRQKVNMSIH